MSTVIRRAISVSSFILISLCAFAQPSIQSFSPVSGPAGSSVVIAGAGFDSAPGGNVVYFGVARATVTAASTGSLTVTVPTGATAEPITVTANHLTARSGLSFTLTYPAGNPVIYSSAFAAHADLSTKANDAPQQTVAADLDGDGRPDVINMTRITGAFAVSVYHNIAGAGGAIFDGGTNYPFVGYAMAAAAGDLDGDGRPEIIVSNQYDSSLAVFHNTSNAGSLSFDPFSKVRCYIQVGYELAIGDLDADGKPEVVLTGSDRLIILKNNSVPGTIQLDSLTTILVSQPGGIAINDLDGDGKADLTVSFNTSNLASGVLFFQNKSVPGSLNLVALPVLNTPVSGNFVLINDMDGDGRPDLALAGYTGPSSVRCFRNTSASGSISFAAAVSVPLPATPMAFSTGDVDGDGKPELVAVLQVTDYSKSDTITILKNNSTPGNLAFSPRLNLVAQLNATGVFVADVDGDGKPDVVSAQRITGKSISLFRNRNNEPYIQSFLPRTAFSGGLITIRGLGFTGASAVSFGGVAAASFTVVNDSVITATIASGGKSGEVSVATMYGTFSLPGFVWQTALTPVIRSIAPLKAPIGGAVTITGENFDPIPANNAVYFGGMKATVTAGSATSLTVTVPPAVGNCQLTVTANQLTAWSKDYFSPSFSGVINAYSQSSFAQEVLSAAVAPPILNEDDIQMDNLFISDLNGDGKPDALARGTNANLIYTFLNTGGVDTAMFKPWEISSIGSFIYSIALGDLDGDGKQELIACASDSGAIYFKNTSTAGSIIFKVAGHLPDRPAFSSYDQLAVGDVDGDGKPDLVAWRSSDGNHVYVYRNSTVDGVIRFDNAMLFEVGGTSAYTSKVYIADLDGDNKPEIIKINDKDNTLSVLKNNCKPGVLDFATKQDVPAGPAPKQVVIGDIDGDGRPDMVVNNYTSNDYTAGANLTVLQNNSTPAAISLSIAQRLSVGPSFLLESALGDMDGDGKLDVLVGVQTASVPYKVSLFPNTSNPGQLSFGTRWDYAGVAGSPMAVDLNGDGYTDIVGAHHRSISMFKSQVHISEDMYNPPVITSVSPASGPGGTLVTITGSHFGPTVARNTVYFGGLKAVVKTATTTSLTVTVPKGAPFMPISVTKDQLTTFSTKPWVTTFPGSAAPLDHSFLIPVSDTTTSTESGIPYNGNNAHLATGDLDGDGLADLVVTNAGGTVSVFRNNGQGGKFPFVDKKDYINSQYLSSSLIMDVDGDGYLDLVVFGDFTYVLLNTSTQGVVSFAAPFKTTIYGSAGAGWQADFDGDGRPDVLTSRAGIFRNITTSGVVSFEYVPLPPINADLVAVATGDYNGDGKPDLVMTYDYESGLSVFSNQTSPGGKIQFSGPVTYKVGSSPWGIASGDLDGDGKIDLVVANGSDTTVSIFRNTGSGSALSFDKTTLRVGYAPLGLTIADLNGDGKPDLATAHNDDYYPETSSFHLMKNISTVGKPAFEAPAIYQNGKSSVALTISDWNTDGTPDLLVIGKYPSRIFLWANQAGRPVVTGFSPKLVSPGDRITISGYNLTGASSVLLGGTAAASYTVDSDTQITAVVGEGMEGYVWVGNSIAADSAGDLLFRAPVITAVTPLSGGVGTEVQIKGDHFSTVAANNNVFFGPVKGEVTAAAVNSLTVKAPAGADLRHISISVFGESASYSSGFDVRFASIGKGFTAASFGERIEVPTGDAPQAVASGDLDGDGLPDLVAGNYVFRNTGGPGMVSLAAKQTYSNYTKSPVQVIVDDIDGDGRLDIIRLDFQVNNLAIFLNTTTSTGAITFGPETDFDLPFDVLSLAIGDLDGDGKKDIVAASGFGSPSVRILRNTSVGNRLSFVRDASDANVVGTDATSVIVDDLDGDNKLDIVLVNYLSQNLRIFRNTGTAGGLAFSPNGPFLSTDALPMTVTSSDLDGDGKPDLIVTEEALASSSGVLIFRNQGTPGSIAFSGGMKINTESYAYLMPPAIGDWDGDGRPDLIGMRAFSGDSLYLFKNISASGSIGFQPGVKCGLGYSVSNILAADLDKDGRPEIVTVNKEYSPGNISILHNQEGAAHITPSGAHPVSGPIANSSTIDTTGSTLNGAPYVQRHYDIQPVNNPSTSTATVTLLFMQDDFDKFNATPGHGGNLPTGPGDNAGKANLRVYQYHGFSVTGQPGTYSGGGTEIDPADGNIVWNAQYQWWEVTFDVTGFSGFFLSSVGFPFNQTPAPIVGVTGNLRLCVGDSVLLTSSSPLSNQWYKDGHVIDGAVSGRLLVKSGGVYTVTATNNNLVSPPSAALTITVDVPLVKPVITLNKGQLQSSIAAGNQWYLNGLAIPGAVGMLYQPTVEGHYTVRDSLGACISPLSDAYMFKIDAVIRLDDTHYLTVGPNPFRDQVVFRFNLEGNTSLSVRIFDMQGRLCYSSDKLTNGGTVDLTGLAKGIYVAKIFSGDNKVRYTIRLQKG